MLKNRITNSIFNNIFYSLYSVAAREESKLSPFRRKWSARTDRDLYIIFPCFTSPSALAGHLPRTRGRHGYNIKQLSSCRRKLSARTERCLQAVNFVFAVIAATFQVNEVHQDRKEILQNESKKKIVIKVTAMKDANILLL